MEFQINTYQREILLAMRRLNKHVYEGTVSVKEKARRRAAGRVARDSRRHNR